MIIKIMVEDTKENAKLFCEHGLCIYFEFGNRKYLFDLGKSDVFFKNANIMNIDIENIDGVFISHGHYDHGGGLERFLSINQKAKVYLNKEIFGDYYSSDGKNLKYIGLNKKLKNNDRFLFMDDRYDVCDGLLLFSKTNRIDKLNANRNIYVLEDNRFRNDKFAHEQYLLIRNKDKNILLTGCSHKGIRAIVEKSYEIMGCYPDYILGGFHLYRKSTDENEKSLEIKQIGEFLKKTGSMIYTFHCTGEHNYEILKNILEDKIEYLRTGSNLNI